jgi:hypothetical protein
MSARDIAAWPLAQTSDRPPGVGLWLRRSASSATAWTVGATMRSRLVWLRTPHCPGQDEVAEPAMLAGMITARQQHEIQKRTHSAEASLSE